MTDLTRTIAPKSDQLNADDLIGRTLDITVTRVSLCGEPDQPIAINFVDDANKPYKPCKSMRRVLVNVWGGDGNAYVGRSMTLYRDEGVQFGGLAVGGIRISHMSDIERPVTMALTATRASRKPYTVKPLVKVAPKAIADDAQILELRQEGDAEADRGTDALREFWKARSAAEKRALGGEPQLDKWKTRAAKIDASIAADPDLQGAAE